MGRWQELGWELPRWLGHPQETEIPYGCFEPQIAGRAWGLSRDMGTRSGNQSPGLS